MDNTQKQAIDYSKIPHEDVTDTYRYVNLPRRFFEALAQGSITPLMFNVLAWIWARAGYKTGIAKRVTAETILDDLFPAKTVPKKERPSLSTMRRVLRQLVGLGYITLPVRYKYRKNYSIIAHGYVTVIDGRKLSLRPKETNGYVDKDDEFDAPSETPSKTPGETPVAGSCLGDDCSLAGVAGEAGRSKLASSNSSAAAPAVVLTASSSSAENPETGSPGTAKSGEGWDYAADEDSISFNGSGKAQTPVQPVEKPPVQSPAQPNPDKPAVKPSSQPPPNPPPTEEAAGCAARFADLRSRPVSPDDTRKFAALLRDYPGCGYLLDFALIPGSKTAGDIRDARSPLAYLKSGLKDGWLQDRWDKWEEKKAAHEQIQADRAKQPSESKPDDEDFGSEPKAAARNWDLSGLDE